MSRLDTALAELAQAIREEVAAAVRSETESPDRLLSVKEAAGLLSCGRTIVYGEIAAGRLRSLRVGRRRLVPASAVAEFINKVTAQGDWYSLGRSLPAAIDASRPSVGRSHRREQPPRAA